jgi:hypothetical protein
MTDTVDPPPPAARRRLMVSAVVRSLSIVVVLTVAFFILPLKRLATVPFFVIVVGGVVILTAVTIYQVRSIIQARNPVVKAIEALTLTVPLFLLLFASTYFLMSQADAGNFSQPGLSRTDALYFTVTVFTTVGFGDIAATSQSARALVTVQMILDLVIIGAVVRAFIQAVRIARANPAAPSTDA